MAQTEQGEKAEQLLLPENLEDCHAELSAARQELEETKDKYLRAAAQIENVRKWTERDVLARSKEDQRKLLRQFLEVMDNLERALAQPAELAILYQGVQLTQKHLGKVLTQAGVERLKVEPGQVFDPTYHEGVEVRFGDVDQMMIAEVLQPGYLYESELLRPAGVVVVRPKG
ncbi:MAG TPA: nucleotide exchange factor GrpE [Anaerolineales bacterium]